MEGFHIGKLIQAELKAQGRTVTWFAKAIHCDRTNAYKIFKSSHIDTELLFRISQVLDHNFIMDFARYYEQRSDLSRHEADDVEGLLNM